MLILGATLSSCGANMVNSEISNDTLDSAIVYTKKNNHCFDCSNYAEIFITLFNGKETQRKLPFYIQANNGETNFYIDWQGKYINLVGNESHPIILNANQKLPILLIIKDNYWLSMDSTSYFKLIQNILQEGKLKYVDNVTNDTLEIYKSKQFKIVSPVKRRVSEK